MKVSTSQKRLDISLLLKVNVEQFYGIEIEDFPCQVAMVGMWLVDHQMNIKVRRYAGSEEFINNQGSIPVPGWWTEVVPNVAKISRHCG